MRTRPGPLGMAAIAISIAASGASADIVIDDFEIGAEIHLSDLSGAGAADAQYPLDPAHVIGTRRDTWVSALGPSEVPATADLVYGAESDDAIVFSHPNGGYLSLGYFPSADLSAGGTLDRFQIVVTAVTAPIPYDLGVVADGGGVGLVASVTSPGTYTLLFADAAFDFSDIETVGLSASLPGSEGLYAITIADFRVVPEPALESMGLAALLTITLLGRRPRVG